MLPSSYGILLCSKSTFDEVYERRAEWCGILHIPSLVRGLDYLQQSSPKIQDLFVLWVALQVKGSIPIFSLLQQQDLKDNTLCK